ncbi:hypothetical protein SEPCBS119000_003471 [Sporothrix epigloea]|uniref:Uncharacterized protein n=1 Tax=Sporothrix epigloea TaxID=1892477 RepID=A0ABP0DQF4_9PEZI
MTGAIRFPRGGRPNKVTKPPVSPTRRLANGSNSSTAPTSAARQLAIEQAIDEQQQQQQQHFKVTEVVTDPTGAVVAEQAALESAQALIQDGPRYNTPEHAQGGADGDGAVTQAQPGGKSKAQTDDCVMLDLQNGGSGDADEGDDTSAGAAKLVTDMDEAEMREMVSGAVESYAGENGINVPRLAPTPAQPSSGNHGLDMDLSAAAAAAAAAAAMASASQLAATGLDHIRRRSERSICSPQPPQDPSTVHSNHASPGTIPPHPHAGLAMTREPTKGDAIRIHDDSLPESPPNTCELAYDSGYRHIAVESALSRRLARVPGIRLAHQRRPGQQLNLGRRSNVEALFAHIAGKEVAVPCKNCHKGHGPWTTCVTVDGQMCGSCANCWFNASGARCSFHEAKTTMFGHPSGQSIGGTAPVLPSLGATSAMDSHSNASPETRDGFAARHDVHHFTAQQQQQQQQHPFRHLDHNRSHVFSSTLGLSRLPLTAATQSSSAAQQAAAAAAAAAIAVQKLTYGSQLADANGMGKSMANTETLNDRGASTSSPFSTDLITSLLGASRSSSIGGGGAGGEVGGDAASADTAPLVGFIISQALDEVRNADQHGRDLMLVEIAAKQLALAIVRFGEGVGAAGEASSGPGFSASSADDTFSNLHKDGPVGAD